MSDKAVELMKVLNEYLEEVGGLRVDDRTYAISAPLSLNIANGEEVMKTIQDSINKIVNVRDVNPELARMLMASMLLVELQIGLEEEEENENPEAKALAAADLEAAMTEGEELNSPVDLPEKE